MPSRARRSRTSEPSAAAMAAKRVTRKATRPRPPLTLLSSRAGTRTRLRHNSGKAVRASLARATKAAARSLAASSTSGSPATSDFPASAGFSVTAPSFFNFSTTALLIASTRALNSCCVIPAGGVGILVCALASPIANEKRIGTRRKSSNRLQQYLRIFLSHSRHSICGAKAASQGSQFITAACRAFRALRVYVG